MQKSPSRTKLRNLQNLKFTRRRKFYKQAVPENGFPQAQATNPKSRLLIVWGILVAAGLGLAFNLYRLQIIDGAKLTQRARNQQMVNVRPFIPRRPVVDRNNNMLAIDRPVYTLYAHPKLFDKSKEEIAEKIAPILNKDARQLVKTFESRSSGILIANGIGENIADRLISFRLNGLEFIQKYSRFYPQDDLVANVVGYVNLDRQGQAGVEYSQETLLERSRQTVRLSRAGNGAIMPTYAPEGFLHSDDLKLQLTIDNRLQRAARTALKEQIDKFQAKRGAVIVMDATDGSLLALVSHPTYNANQYSKADISLFRNWPVADLYEPGSTFKPLIVAIALENGVIKPEDVFNDPGTIKVADRIIKNAEINSFRRINIAEILQTSSNVGMVQIIQRLKPRTYYNWLEKLGLGQKMDTDLPFAVSGSLKRQEKFLSSNLEPATTSFGQGFSLTPLQLVQMHGALANGGKLITPHVVEGLIDNQGKIHYSPNLPAPRQIFSPTTTQKVMDMMETVVSQGSGKASQIKGYGIAGKTGTAQKASPKGGYIPGARITSFVGIVPAEAPRYVVLAIVDEPKGANAYGGTVTAPIVKSVMEVLIPMQKIPPSQQVTGDN
ncbi:MAG: peptidoglycan D,D-transpeptidase FtsI family protein [Sphaerospermopsis kisseleviana]|uniref:peptidoglycan D,D-transpeptidase FtsI family protein n=1 Tax=unclassified Sphaerospermopsis TaxID=2646443 RepID=UPI0016814E7A|nr:MULTISPECIES: penicillin-binding protein 2 [unclassified Sphaerospermopsis]MBD2133270.1 penicillin-binding protein 2 [Sphaerospermopsis sp. FACHB-1094]MBD2146892.1 penicillin-binding protein 2 [Sphaerospermopsis sp. FACHB-1194]